MILLAAVLSAAGQISDPAPPSLVVEAKLLAKSDTPPMDKIFIYREGLAVYEYQVVKAIEGQPKAGKILVTHWAVKRGLTQAVTQQNVGDTVTLKLCPFDDINRLDEAYERHTIANVTSPLYHDVGQQLKLPDAGRWNYNADLSRNMRAFHLLKDPLKLVVLGDCQGWFSSKTELYFGDENRKTPVALSLTQERSGLDFYKMSKPTGSNCAGNTASRRSRSRRRPPCQRAGRKKPWR